MAKARNWEALKPATRKRYERAGISRSEYLSGVSLKAARGHGVTPERPNRKPQPGQEQYWVNRIVKRAFETTHSYRGPKTVGEGGIPVPTADQLELAQGMDAEELRDLASAGNEWSWLWYH